MYILVKISDMGLVSKLLKYLKKIGCFVREFSNQEYRVNVTAEERSALINPNKDEYLNPPAAWKTCASVGQIWDWDSLGRGPYPISEYDQKNEEDPAPKGKGYIVIRDQRVRVAGECANPTSLNYISCTKWCTKYEPINVEAAIYVAEEVEKEHLRRAEVLRRQIEFLKKTDLGFKEAVAKGLVFDYSGGLHRISEEK